MKTIRLLFLIGLISITSCGFAQNWKSDPGYSTHNYKHPNKAAKAKESIKENSSGTAQQVNVQAGDNYKGQNNLLKRKSIWTFPFGGSSAAEETARNYKQQFRPKGNSETDIIKKDSVQTVQNLGQ